MAVNSGKRYPIKRQSLFYRLKSFAGFEREAEFAVDLAGADKIMGVRIYSGLYSEHYFDRFSG